MAFAQYQFRRDTASNWANANPTLLAGEFGYETDTFKFKLGTGTTAWNSLSYGGIKGDTGTTGATGAAGTNGTNGWSPVLANLADGERRVLRLIDWTGGTGTKPTVPTDNYIGATGFTNLTNATDIRGATGATGAAGAQGATGVAGNSPNAFTNIAVSGQSTIVADNTADTLTFVGSGSVTITTDPNTDTMTISGSVAVPQNCFSVITGNTGTSSADLPSDTLAITGGTGISTVATDTPDGLVINNTGVTSVNGQTGAVTIPILGATTRTAPTASASTVLTTIQSYPLATGEVVAGSEYEFYASLRVINTTTATNAVVTLSVGAVNVLVLTQAIGATAAAAPGAAVDIYGRITFYSATAAEATIRASKQAAVAFDAVANTSASVTVAAATATTIDLKFNTSGATSTFIARQATIRKVK